jgi:hypothetical protein
MATIYEFDLRNLPEKLKKPGQPGQPGPQDDFVKAVRDELKNSYDIDDSDALTHAAVVGILLLGENFDPLAPGFTDAIRRGRDELLAKTRDYSGNLVSNKRVYERIEEIIPTLPGRGEDGAGNVHIFYQEFASVGRFVIRNAAEIPLGHPHLPRQVERAEDEFVGGPPIFDSLDLPPLTGNDGSDTEIEPENIKAVGMIYAAYELEDMRLFNVVDRITELFQNGQLPIGFDAGGRAIDDYLWNAEDRMNEAARRMVYSRVLGVKGGDVSKEVQPNTQFQGLFIRFLSSLAEYDRQQRVADIVQSNRPLNLTSEYVRKAGRDLAANLSLYGWGGTHFAARRLRQHIDQALDMLKQPSVQKAYGVTNIYGVIERVASSEFNTVPNIVKNRTMAEAGKAIIDIVAKHADKWGRTGTAPLFSEQTIGFNNPNPINPDGGVFNPVPPDIPDQDRDTLLRQTQYWLAVNGIKDEQVDKYSEPEIAAYAPSLPSFGGFNGGGAAKGNGNSPDGMEKIKQMVTQGQIPSLDQLQQLFSGPKLN